MMRPSSNNFTTRSWSLIASDARPCRLWAADSQRRRRTAASPAVPPSIADEAQAARRWRRSHAGASQWSKPGDTATSPRTETPTSQSAVASRLQPRESPSAGDSFPDGSRLNVRASSAFPSVLAAQRLPSHLSSAEQSNTSIIYGKQLFLKLYRRLQPEENPDVEVGRFLTEVAHFNGAPPFLGEISLTSDRTEKTTLALLQGLVANQGDGWEWYLTELCGWLPAAAQRAAPAPSFAPAWLSVSEQIPESLEAVRSTLEAAALLGTRTAELHLALSSGTNLVAFAPEPLTSAELARDAAEIELQIKSALGVPRKIQLPCFG